MMGDNNNPNMFQFLKCGCLFSEKAVRPSLQSDLLRMLSFMPLVAMQ